MIRRIPKIKANSKIFRKIFKEACNYDILRFYINDYIDSMSSYSRLMIYIMYGCSIAQNKKYTYYKPYTTYNLLVFMFIEEKIQYDLSLIYKQ